MRKTTVERNPVYWRLFAAAIVTMMLAVSCGGTAESPAAVSELSTEPVTLTIQIFNAGGQAELEYRQAQGADFTKLHPSVTIEIVQSSAYIDTLLPQIVAETAGDVLWTDTDTGFTQFAVAGAFEPLDGYIAADGYDTSVYPTALLKAFQLGGAQLVMPNSVLPFNFVYYNKNIFAAAGVAEPTGDWTIDEFVKAARATTDKSAGRYGLTLAWTEQYVAWMRMYGCELSDDDSAATAYTYNGPGCAISLKTLDDLSREAVLNWALGAKFGGLPKGDVAGESNFSAGNVAMLISGTWESPAIIANSAGAFEWNAVSVPVEGNGKIQGAASGFGVSASSKNKAWAWEYVKFLTDIEGQKKDAIAGFNSSPISVVLDDVYCKSDAPPLSKCEITKIGNANIALEPITGAWSEGFWSVVSAGLDEAFTADKQVDWQKHLDKLVEESSRAAPLK
jgi:ABC-type glycerol-3-phosphate transport system substrate-binding protein